MSTDKHPYLVWLEKEIARAAKRRDRTDVDHILFPALQNYLDAVEICLDQFLSLNPPSPSLPAEGEKEDTFVKWIDGEIDRLQLTKLGDPGSICRTKIIECLVIAKGEYLLRIPADPPQPSPIGQESGLQKEVPEWVNDLLVNYKRGFISEENLIRGIKKYLRSSLEEWKSKCSELQGLISNLKDEITHIDVNYQSSLEEKQREIEELKGENDDYKAALQTICDNSDNSWWTNDEQSLHKIVQEVLAKYPIQSKTR